MAKPQRRALIVAALLLGVFLSALEATVVATVMPTVIAELGGITLYGWVASSYLLVSTVSVPIYGKVADLYGRKRVLLFGIAIFLVGSVASALATSIELLIAARFVQGIGAGAMGPVTLTIVGDIFTIEERGRVQGFFGAVWGISAIVGPLLGGAIVSVASWRWVFWINVPFGLASMIALMKVFHEAPRARSEHPFDWAGAFVLTLGSTLLLVGASRVRPEVTLPLGVALLVLFAWIEHRAVDPVLPLDLALERPIFVAAISSVLLGAAMMGILTYVPLHAQGVLGRTPTEAGASVAPMLVGWPIASAATSRLLMRTGFRAPVWLGAFFCGGALAFFAWEVGPHVTLFGTQAAMFVYGMGMGLTNTALIIAVQSSVQWKQRGVATAMNLFARSMGQTLGVGALGSILAVSLTGALAPEAINRLLEPHVEKGTTVAAGEALAALERGLEPMFWWIALFGLLNVVVVAFYPRHQAVVADAKPTPEPHV